MASQPTTNQSFKACALKLQPLAKAPAMSWILIHAHLRHGSGADREPTEAGAAGTQELMLSFEG